mmetsp:Transcript_13467/g.33620  ORF Transcript_13467/g.33620 Transcript_13467/m.33620 type:complete len:253 (-) Transcript_13467:884-1642(-)
MRCAPRRTSTVPPALGKAVSTCACLRPSTRAALSSICTANSSGPLTSTTTAFLLYHCPLASFLSTTRTRMLSRTHALHGSSFRASPRSLCDLCFLCSFSSLSSPRARSRFSALCDLCFLRPSPLSPSSSDPSAAASPSLFSFSCSSAISSIARSTCFACSCVNPTRCFSSCKSRTGRTSAAETVTSSPFIVSRPTTRSCSSSPPTLTTRAYSPSCTPAVIATTAPLFIPVGPRSTSFSPTFFTCRCRPCSST